MGIYSVQYAREGSDTDTDDKFVRNYAEVYQVLTDDPTVTSVQVRTAFGLPVQYDSYPWDPEALCLGLTAKPTDPSRLRWEVTAKYSTKYDQQEDQNPLNRPVKWSMTTQQFTKVMAKDLNGKAVVNSAGDPFENPVEIDDGRITITAVRNEASLPIWAASAYKDAINSKTWKSVAKKQAKLMSIASGEIQSENGYQFYAVTYQFAVTTDPNGWQPVVADLGYNAIIIGGDGNPKAVQFAGGLIHFLQKNADGTVVVAKDANNKLTQTYLTNFVFFPEVDFNNLNLTGP